MSVISPERSVSRARKRRDRAEREFAEAVAKAYAARGDVSVDRIAKAAGITRQRVWQIVNTVNEPKVKSGA